MRSVFQLSLNWLRQTETSRDVCGLKSCDFQVYNSDDTVGVTGSSPVPPTIFCDLCVESLKTALQCLQFWFTRPLGEFWGADQGTNVWKDPDEVQCVQRLNGRRATDFQRGQHACQSSINLGNPDWPSIADHTVRTRSVLSSVISSIAYRTPSRPNPLRFTPP